MNIYEYTLFELYILLIGFTFTFSAIFWIIFYFIKDIIFKQSKKEVKKDDS